MNIDTTPVLSAKDVDGHIELNLVGGNKDLLTLWTILSVHVADAMEVPLELLALGLPAAGRDTRKFLKKHPAQGIRMTVPDNKEEETE